MSIDPSTMRQLLKYDPDSGVFTWKARRPEMFNNGGKYTQDQLCKRWNTRCAGKQAFTSKDGRGYHQTKVLDKTITAHRTAFCLMEGRWPDHVDHISGDISDNRWINLREVDNHENCKNRSMQSNNTTGMVGVRWRSDFSKWVADIKVNGKSIHLGSFETVVDAVASRKRAERLNGFHKNHGRKMESAS